MVREHEVMLMPTVDRYMTREPYQVASTDMLAVAKKLMVEHEIRHLPVVDGGRLEPDGREEA